MLDMLAEVQAELQLDRDAWIKAPAEGAASGQSDAPGIAAVLTSIDEDDAVLGGPSQRTSAGQFGSLAPMDNAEPWCRGPRSLGDQFGGVVPLGALLRRAREEQLQMERRRLVDSVGAGSNKALSSISTPASARGPRRKAPTRSRDSFVPSDGGKVSVSAVANVEPLIVHRHHHHHYHHHYVLGPNDDAHGPMSLHEEESIMQVGDSVGSAGIPSQSTHRGQSGVVEHLHFHRHLGEESVPLAAHLLLHDAGKEAAKRQGAKVDGTAGPDTRLPRLA